MGDLRDRTLFITGGSRGIGKAIALRAARDGARVVLAARTDRPHRTLPGTIHTAADEVTAAGGRALPIACDVRDARQVEAAIARAASEFGGIDVLVNNAGAIRLTGTRDTPIERFDLMFAVNVRAAFLCSQLALPHLQRSGNPHILNMAPPISLDPRWLAPHVAYTITKYAMSMCTIGMAHELAGLGVACNSLWPRTVIATAALALLPGVRPEQCRRPEIVADAAHAIVTRDARACTGHCFLDEEVLAQEGVTDLTRYAVDPAEPLLPDLFVGEPAPRRG